MTSKTISSIQMFVTKRDGNPAPVSFDKILRRLQILANERSPQLTQVNVFKSFSLWTTLDLYELIFKNGFWII